MVKCLRWNLIFVSLSLVSLLFFGIVSADTEPNDDPMSAETITLGTYKGSVQMLDDDSADWYRVIDIGTREFKVSLKILDYQDTEYVNVDSYGPYAIAPDGQVELYVGEGYSEDSCYCTYTDGLGTVYLSVTGNGQYELELEYEKTPEEEQLESIDETCCGMSLALSVVVVIGISFLVGHLKNRK